MQFTLLLSLWGAALSTILGILTILDRTRARPIIRVHAKAQSRNALEKPQFVVALVKTGHYDRVENREFYIEYRVENHGTKPISLRHIYIEEKSGNLMYITPDALPLVLEGQSSETFDLQKEYFDAIDIPTKQRIKGDVAETGFVDALDRRYPIPKKELDQLLSESLSLPTTRAVFHRKNHPEGLITAFQVVHPATFTRRSAKKRQSDGFVRSTLNFLTHFLGR